MACAEPPPLARFTQAAGWEEEPATPGMRARCDRILLPNARRAGGQAATGSRVRAGAVSTR
ncbi:hypothetical protein GCM10009851_15930 [Herbiconiux moechotypicola]|uniref:Transposase n=1 Tax=Herbiconiux moechotypicola TaxID=637393 RepID=A0ABN3DI61_9MICO